MNNCTMKMPYVIYDYEEQQMKIEQSVSDIVNKTNAIKLFEDLDKYLEPISTWISGDDGYFNTDGEFRHKIILEERFLKKEEDPFGNYFKYMIEFRHKKIYDKKYRLLINSEFDYKITEISDITW